VKAIGLAADMSSSSSSSAGGVPPSVRGKLEACDGDGVVAAAGMRDWVGSFRADFNTR
jgi:hypothetical protein